MIRSVNQLLVCEPYKGTKGLKSKVSSGMAVVQQKTEMIGLKVLRDAQISESRTIKKGSVVFIKEEVLYTYREQYGTPLNCSEISEPFVLVNYGHVAFVKEQE